MHLLDFKLVIIMVDDVHVEVATFVFFVSTL
jgi:hypothetical protein